MRLMYSIARPEKPAKNSAAEGASWGESGVYTLDWRSRKLNNSSSSRQWSVGGGLIPRADGRDGIGMAGDATAEGGRGSPVSSSIIIIDGACGSDTTVISGV
jgi:hypothetical protein